jgi:hypothetical protein
MNFSHFDSINQNVKNYFYLNWEKIIAPFLFKNIIFFS